MGVDFLKSKAKPFLKGLDSARVSLARRTLFTRDLSEPVCAIVARSVGPNSLRTGEAVLLRTDGDRLAVVVDLGVRGYVVKPREADIARIKQVGGCVRGQVIRAYPTLDLVEVTTV